MKTNSTSTIYGPISFVEGLRKMVLTGNVLYTSHVVENCRGEEVQEIFQVNWDRGSGQFKLHRMYRRVDGQIAICTTENSFSIGMQEYGFMGDCPLKPRKEYTPAEAYRRLFDGECIRTYDPVQGRTLKIYFNGEGRLRYETEDGTEGGEYKLFVSDFNKSRFYEL